MPATTGEKLTRWDGVSEAQARLPPFAQLAYLRDKTQIPARRSKARRRGCRSSWHWLTTQNLSIGPLQATRNCCVPTLDLCGWLKAQSCSSAMCKFLDKSYCLLCPKAVSLERQCAKIKRMHPTVSVCVKNWMIRSRFLSRPFFSATLPVVCSQPG